jgi:FkbM family methyltransferase
MRLDIENMSKYQIEETISRYNALTRILKFSDKSESQIGQDIFVLSELGFKRNGYFVEFGAANGKHFSNSYLLEKEFGWTGIVAEPGRVWKDLIVKNRTCEIETKCVWTKTGEILTFNETENGELSTIESFSDCDFHSTARMNGTRYEVETISLLDMLQKYNAPSKIDYLSIDTEGSEFEILSSHDFDKYQFQVITCEHNFSTLRDQIYSLLTNKGYVRKHVELSSFDDWYVLAN